MRLDDVADALGDQITIDWKSFMLRPSISERRGREDFVAYTRSWARIAEAEPRLQVTFPWASDDEHPSHSLPALAASKLVATHGPDAESRFHRLAFEAYFGRNRTLSDPGVLADLAADAGLDRATFAEDLESQRDALATQVIDDHKAALAMGISAVPTLVIDDRYGIPGAQDTETYLRVIEDVLAKGRRD